MSIHPTENLPKVHPRRIPVEQAEREIITAVYEIEKKYSLTLAEVFYIIATIMQRNAWGWVRAEREADG